MQKHIWDDQFFVLDSDHLEQASTRLYGYCFHEERLVENHTLPADGSFEPTGIGCYVYLCREGGKLTIAQDSVGCYGLYLFRKDGYFAVSNGFLSLVEYLRGRYPLTLNRAYADMHLACGLCSMAYDETMIEEITKVDRSAVVEIDVERRSLDVRMIDYEENTVPLDSEEGMALLDAWVRRWSRILRGIRAETDNLTIDLSGGFDSRVTFALALKAGIRMDDVNVYSIEDTLHTHGEDFQIASEIAEHYGFALNNRSKLDLQDVPLSMDDILGLSFYTKLGFHKQMYFETAYHARRQYQLGGRGAACIRTFWNDTPDVYLQKSLRAAGHYPWRISRRIADSTERVVRNSIAKTVEKFHVDDPASPGVLIRMYRETRNIYHFGRVAVESYMANSIILMPLLDPQMNRLAFGDSRCRDNDLLMALMYVRYFPEMLDFRFNGNRNFRQETLRFARELSARYPYDGAQDEPVLAREKTAERPLRVGRADHSLSSDDVIRYLKEIFAAPAFRERFEAVYNGDVYRYVARDMAERDYHPLTQVYAALAIVKAADDATGERSDASPKLLDFLAGLRESGAPEHALPEVDTKDCRALMIFKNFCAEGAGTKDGLVWLDMDDDMAALLKPYAENAQDNGCFVVESGAGRLGMTVQCAGDGRLRVDLRSPRANGGSQWISYTRLTVNGKAVIRQPMPVCDEEPYVHIRKVKDGEKLRIELAWEEYRRLSSITALGNLLTHPLHALRRLKRRIRT